MRKIGIMGGTFDPIHTGHLLLAERSLDELGLDEVWMVPTGISYKKADREVLPGEERLRMAELAVKKNPRLRCLDMEIRRTGYTYTYETLELLKEEYPDTAFFFLVGADCLFDMESWKYPERILQNCTLVAVMRSEVSTGEMAQKRQELMERFGGEIVLMPFMRIDITSTEIRERIRNQKSVRYMVPEETLAYIEEKGFYCDEKSGQHETPAEGSEKDAG